MMNTHISNIWRLGIKELRSLWADRVLLVLIVWAFTGDLQCSDRCFTRTESCSRGDCR